MSLVIFVSDRTNKITCHICQQASIIIGRSQESDVQLDDASVSKAHCRVDRADGGVSVTDLGSSNGVFVNGERQGETRMIGASDLVQIMDFTLMVRALSADEALRFEAGQDPRCVAPAPLLELTRILKEKASEPSLADGLSSPLTPPREPSLNSIVNVLAPSEPAPSGRQPSSLNSIFDAVTPAPSEPAPSGRQPSSLNSILDAVTPAPSEPAPSGRQPSSLNSVFDAVTPPPSEPTPSGRQPSSLNSIFDAVTPSSRSKLSSPQDKDEE